MRRQETYLEFNDGRPSCRKLRFAYIIEALLRSRESVGLQTGSHRPDEDVNMYLTELLCRYAESTTGSNGAHIIPYESELFERIREVGETRAKFLIYRHNADHLLVTLGIFGNAWWRTPRESAFHWAPTREQSIARGKIYYGKASTYASRLEDGRRGLDELLFKLEVGFEEYLRILEALRGEYFHFVQGFSSGEWYHLCRELGVNSGAQPPADSAV